MFKALVGEIDLDHGEVARSRGLKIGYLQQFDTWNEGETLESFLSRDTVIPIWDLKRMGIRLGLKQDMFDRPIQSLSGGYRMRVKLLHLLGQKPNLMLLDEPTNYLDLETVLVLEEFLQELDGAFLLISHDREFLRRTTDHILEIESGDMTKFAGNIDDYFEQKAMLREQLEKQALSQQAKKAEILKFAARFGAKASKARQVQSRLKQMNKMESIELKALPISARIKIPTPSPTGRVAIEVKDVDLGYEDRVILQKVHLTIESGDHIGIVGLNGAGKSTFLKGLGLELKPMHGEISYGYQVSSSFYAQHVSERLLPEETVHEALTRAAHKDVRDQEILGMAGSLLFSGDNVKKKIKVLSGGEKARVALGQILLKKSPLLLLDEPTNHLDFYTVEALTQALASYEGSVIIVSHDRGFIRRIANKILEVNHGRIRVYPGTYEDYVWSIQQRGTDEPDHNPLPLTRRSSTATEEVKQVQHVSKPQVSEATKAKIKSLEQSRRDLDKAMQDADKKMKALQSRMNEMAPQLNTAKGTDATKISQELSMMQKKIDELEASFMQSLERKEDLAKEIADLKSKP